MLKAILGLGALLVLCSVIAGKEAKNAAKIATDRVARPIALVTLSIAGFLFFVYPLLI